MQKDDQPGSNGAEHDGEESTLSAEQQNAERGRCRVEEVRSTVGADNRTDPENERITDAHQDQRRRQRPEAMQQGGRSIGECHEGGIFPMRTPVEEPLDSE